MKKTGQAKAMNRKLISLAVASCFAVDVAVANPTAPTVVSGSAAFQQSGNLLSITNSPNAIINWGSFSIGANELTRFIQQSQASAVLNRVIGQDPSAILGALQSNGRVFLVNPNGILFGAGAQVDVAGLVASTLNLSDADFLAGRLRFTEMPGAGSIVNQGSITTGTGGQVYLVAPDITNSGIITSPQGEVVLAAGRSVELVNPGTPNLRVEIDAPDTQAVNLGQIVADSGRIGIYAGLISQQGTLRADSAVVGENGQILLKATQNATLAAGSLTSANGPSGGSIAVQSGDTTLVSGSIEARGTQGQGGTVQVLGNLVGLTDSARIDASGETGGGTVLVGGDYQGKNPDIQNAYRTYFGPDATITADALTSGDGGKVIVWSDDATRAYGTISARGGAQSGNGGLVEVSGKNWLDFNASVDTLAPYGTAGTLLLDPSNIFIAINQASATAFGMSGTDTTVNGTGPSLFDAPGTPSDPTDSLLLTATLTGALSSNNVIVSTASGRSGAGNIGVADPVSWNSPFSLSLLAQNTIISRGPITNAGSGSILLYAGWDGLSTVTPIVTAGAGHDIFVTGSIQTGGNIQLTAGNDITVKPSLASFAPPVIVVIGNTFSITPVAINAGGSFTANAGNDFTLQGALAKATATTTTPVVSDSSASITANSIAITAGGTLTIAGGDNYLARANSASAGQSFMATAVSNATLSATSNISLTGNNITIRGGNGAFSAGVFASNNAGAGTASATANATVTAGGTISLNATNALQISGGSNARASASLNSGGRGNATINANAVVSGTNLTITAGSLTVQGGDNARAEGRGGGSNNATVNVNAQVVANNLDMTIAGPLNINGGGNATAAGSGAAVAGTTATGTVNADAQVHANNTLTVNVSSGDLTIGGGNNASASADFVNQTSTAIVNSNAELSTGGNGTINVSAGNLTVRGGDFVRSSANADSANAVVTTRITAQGRIIANGNLGFTVSGTIDARGGSSGEAAANATFNAGSRANASADVQARITTGGSLTLGAGSLTVRGGGGSGSVSASAVSGAVATATLTNRALVSAGGMLTAQASNTIGVEAPPAPPSSGVLVGGGSLSGGGVALIADTMDIQGSVNAGSNTITVAPATSGRPIELGTVTDPAGVLALSSIELGNLTGGSLVIGSLGATPITITGPITFGPLPNLFGSTITQTTGSTITSPSLNLAATGAVTLNENNNVGTLFAQTFGAPLQFATAGSLNIGGITTGNGNLALTAGGSITVSNPLDAGTGTVTLTSSGGAIVDNHAGTDIIGSSATLSALTGIGSVASPLGTQVSFLNLSSPGGEIGIVNSGTLTLGSSISTSGNVSLAASGGDLNIAGVDVFGQNITLGGNNVNIGSAGALVPTSVTSSGATSITTPGSLTVQGGSGSGASATVDSSGGALAVSAGGDVRVRGGSGPSAFASLIGNPDVHMTNVGGAIRIDAGSGAGAAATIQSVSPFSISAFFPNLAFGGYFVNGVEGVVFDSASASGFLAGGRPAIVDTNLLFTYGISLLSTQLATAVGQPIVTTSDLIYTMTNLDTLTNPSSQTNSDAPGGYSEWYWLWTYLDELNNKRLPVCP